MIDPDIAHLDSNERSPFDALVALDQAITIARIAHLGLLHRLTYDAIRDEQEAAFASVMDCLWSARELLREMAED